MPRQRQHGSYKRAAETGRGDCGCDYPGCDLAGTYPAPRSRRELRDYFWFCLEHIREYNKGWDFYAGMDSDAIERERREDVIWRRPTWPMGAQRGNRRGGADQPIHDGFGLFDDDDADGAASNGANGHASGYRVLGAEERKAMDLLELTPPLTQDVIRDRYKELVKRLHPDANGGDKQAEERLKLVNHAYSTLKSSLSLR